MELIPIEPSRSSQLAAIGFDGNSKLRILFRRGGLYEYGNVSVHEYNDVLTATRPGDVFRDKIKGIKPFRKLDTLPAPTQVPEPPTPAAPAQPSPEPIPAAAEADPKVLQVSKKSSELATQASAIVVVDPASQERASELLLTVAAMRKEIADTWKPMKDAAFKAHRVVCDQERNLDAPLLEAEKILKQRIGGFVAEQQRIAREIEEAQRLRLREEAERIAREESERLALEDAIALEDEGQKEAAEAVLANPVPVAPRYIAPAPVPAAVAQVKGVSTRTVWKFRIVDETKIPRDYLEVNEKAIAAVVTRTSGKIQIPGIETYPDQQVAASRRA